MRINEIEFEFDSLIPKDVERYENAVETFQAKSDALQLKLKKSDGAKPSEIIRDGTNNAIEFINDILGDNACDYLFGDLDTVSILDCLNVMEQIKNEFVHGTKVLNERLKGYSRARLN